MAFRYSITNYNCPHCGKTLKRDDEGLWTIFFIVLFIATAGTILLWLLGAKLVNALYRYEGPRQLGNKMKECPHCGTRVCMSRGMEWVEFSDNEKKCWAFRKFYWLALFFSGFVFVGIVGQLLWLSSHENDQRVALIFIFVLLISFAIELGLYFYWRLIKNTDFIEIGESDFDKISTSMQFTDSRWEDELIPIKIKATGKIYGRLSKADNSNNNQAQMLLLYKELLDKGAITQEEYNEKKKQILGR